MSTMWRSRWAAVGAAVAITLGAGGIGLVEATKTSGERAVYTAIEPCRLLDTRPNWNIGRNTPLGEGEIYELTAHGDNGECEDIPADTLALELNVTGLLNTAGTDFVIWSGAGDPPNASHVNLALGAAPTPNSVTTELDGPNFSIRNKFGDAHVIIDIVGIYQDHNHDDRYDDVQGAIDGEDSSVPGVGATDTVVATVTVDTPTSGYVMLNASAYVFAAANAQVRCSISSSESVDEDQLQITTIPAGTYSGISGTRGFQINKFLVPAGTGLDATYHFVCDTNFGTVSVSDAYLNAVFVPDPDAFSGVIAPLPDTDDSVVEGSG